MALIDSPVVNSEIAIEADLSRLPEVRTFAQEAALLAGFDDEAAYMITMAASEAAANAIEHGSSAPGDEIQIKAAVEGPALAFYITDRGRFVPRVTRGAMPERGRGLHTISALMDEVDLTPGAGGTVLRFAKRF